MDGGLVTQTPLGVGGRDFIHFIVTYPWQISWVFTQFLPFPQLEPWQVSTVVACCPSGLAPQLTVPGYPAPESKSGIWMPWAITSKDKCRGVINTPHTRT